MARPAFPNIGWDPTPGDVELTREVAKQLGTLASELGTTHMELARISCGAWKGEAARAFSGHVQEDLAPLIKKSHSSFDKASRALYKWAGQLDGFQREAELLEKEAGEKAEALNEARTREKNQSGEERDKAEKDGKGVTGAASAVDEVTRKVYDLQDRVAEAARLIAKELDKAGDIAPDKPGLFSRIANGIKNAVEWVKDHADVIKLIGDLLSDLSAVLGFLAIITLPFPPLAAIFGTAALIASGLALTTHLTAMAAGADVSWMSIGLDAVGLLPGIGMFGKSVKVVKGSKAAQGLARTGFKVTKNTDVTKLVAFGKQAKDAKDGVRLLGQRVVLGGKYGNLAEMAHGSGLRTRMAGVANQGYYGGQWVGSRGLSMLTRSKVDLDPFGGAARALDAGLKIAPKVVSIPQHIGEAVNPGDRFNESAAAH